MSLEQNNLFSVASQTSSFCLSTKWMKQPAPSWAVWITACQNGNCPLLWDLAGPCQGHLTCSDHPGLEVQVSARHPTEMYYLCRSPARKLLQPHFQCPSINCCSYRLLRWCLEHFPHRWNTSNLSEAGRGPGGFHGSPLIPSWMPGSTGDSYSDQRSYCWVKNCLDFHTCHMVLAEK